MTDTMRAVRSAIKGVHVRRGGFSMPVRRYSRSSWCDVHARGYYGCPYKWKRGLRHG